LATTVARIHTPRLIFLGATKGAVYKDKSHSPLELKETIANFIRKIPPIGLSHVFAYKTRCVYIRTCWSFPTFVT
jgi:hypothetical protein